LIELIRECVEKELTPVFYSASEETGTGMKMRMTDSIVEAVGEVVPKAFENAHHEIRIVVDGSLARVKKLIVELTLVLARDARKVESIFAKVENTGKLFDELQAQLLDSKVKSIIEQVQAIDLEIETVEQVVATVPTKPFLILDGSNVATETDLQMRKVTKLKTLLSCKRAIENEYPGHELIIFVDANFKFALEDQELKQFEELEVSKEITRTPGGVEADSVILKIAKRNNARIITGDRYRDWVKSYPIISEPGRIIAPTYVSATDQWIFNPRTRI
jgi:predicted nuclease of predicted toxin-antitoxin system